MVKIFSGSQKATNMREINTKNYSLKCHYYERMIQCSFNNLL